MEASIIFHFAGRGDSSRRLALVDFRQLLDPRWKAPADWMEGKPAVVEEPLSTQIARSAYNFGLVG